MPNLYVRKNSLQILRVNMAVSAACNRNNGNCDQFIGSASFLSSTAAMCYLQLPQPFPTLFARLFFNKEKTFQVARHFIFHSKTHRGLGTLMQKE